MNWGIIVIIGIALFLFWFLWEVRRESKKINYKKKKRPEYCKECGKILAPQNKSGLCSGCYIRKFVKDKREKMIERRLKMNG